MAVAPFHTIERTYESEYGTYPALLGFTNHDSVNVWNAYENMSRVIPMFERRFGPYRWDRVGYVSTTRGSMEHVGNVAFTTPQVPKVKKGGKAGGKFFAGGDIVNGGKTVVEAVAEGKEAAASIIAYLEK